MGAPVGGAPLRTLGGRYALLHVLGHGARATVYRGEDRLLGRGVAVKVLETGAADGTELRAQEAEARRLASLSMHGLVTLYDVGIELAPPGPPTVFLVLELVEGTDLKRMLGRGPLPARQAAHVGLDLAEALAYMHERGVVHGDVTPANVLVLDHGADRRLRVKLGDFGVQDLVGAAGAAGAYRSPEQASGGAAVAASDVFALGLVLLECLTVGSGTTDAVPEGAWRRTVAAMLDPDPAARPDAASLVDAFRAIVVEETGRHRSRSRPQDEEQRLAALKGYGVLDTPPDAAFDRIAQLAARVLGVAGAAIGLIDADRVWFKSRLGPVPAEVPRDAPLAAALQDERGEAGIADATADPAFATDPLVTGGVRFAAAAPIVTAEGSRIGMLAVVDVAERTLGEGERASLADLAAIVLHELELRRAARRMALARR